MKTTKIITVAVALMLAALNGQAKPKSRPISQPKTAQVEVLDWLPPGGPTPAQARQAVEYFIHRTFFDPYSVQDLTIGTPYWNTRATTHHDWIIPFECNAKNRMGGYVGIHQMAIMWKNGGIDIAATQDYMQWQAFFEGVRQGLQ